MDKLDLNAINPFVRMSWFFHPVPKGRIKGPRINFDYEVIFVNSGEIILDYENKTYICKPETFIFIPPGIVHTITTPNVDSNYCYLHFDLQYSMESLIRPISSTVINLHKHNDALIQQNIITDTPPCPILNFKDHAAAKRLYFNIVQDIKATARDAKDTLLEKELMLKFINMIIHDHFPEFYSNCQSTSPDIAIRIKNYIDAGNFDDDLSGLESQFAFSRFYLEKAFKKAYCMSIIKYRNIRKMDAALLMLKRESVSNVAEKLGYSSIYAFSKAFKQHFGFAPSNIKKNKFLHDGKQ